MSKFEAYGKREAVSGKKIKALIKTLGSLHASIIGIDFGQIDVSLGRAVLKDDAFVLSHCMWLKDGRRLTISVGKFGGFSASLSTKIDPTRPKEKI